jgi:hypothetical protein
VSGKGWLRLLGTRYRCVPLYLPVEEFDPLSRLFLEVLRHEHSVARLVRAFGLTERVVEDVLGDLIRRNRAALVIKEGVREIRLLDDDAVPNLVYRPGETLDVWQDHATGLVLPAWMIDPHERPRSDDGEAPGDQAAMSIQAGSTMVGSFIDAPDAQLIDMLIRADDELRQRDETVELLDRLGERYRVRPQAVWLQVVDAAIQGQIIPLIAADFIPPWIARVWSVALRRDSFVAPVEEVAFHIASTTDQEGVRVVHGWRATALLDAWHASVERFLSLKPAPVSGYDLREVRERQAAIGGLFLSLGRIALRDDREAVDIGALLDPVLDVSRHWAVLVLPLPGQARAALESLQGRVLNAQNLPSTVVLVLPSYVIDSPTRDEFQAVLGSSRFATIAVRNWPATGPAVALSDGPELRLSYGPESSILKLSGEALAAEWLSLLQGLPSMHPRGSALERAEGEPLRPLRVRRDPIVLSDGATFGLSSEAPSVVGGVEELRAFGEGLLTAIVDPSVIHREWSDGAIDSFSDFVFDRSESLGQQLPFLSQRCDALLHQLLVSPSPPWASWTRLAGHDLLPVFVGVLTEPGRRSVEGRIDIFSDIPSEAAVWSSVIDLIQKATEERGWTIHISFPREPRENQRDACKDAAAALRKAIPSHRLRLWRLKRAFPARALVIDDLTFLAGGDWLSSILKPSHDTPDFGFALESRDFAQTLRSCLIGATELLPMPID